MEIGFLGIIALAAWISWLILPNDVAKPAHRMKMHKTADEFKAMATSIAYDLNALPEVITDESLQAFAKAMYLQGQHDLLAEITAKHVEPTKR